jgi:flagellar protein FliJ
MRRFVFRLEQALTLRRRLEEQAQVALAESERRREHEHAQLVELHRERERHETCRAGLQREALDITVLVDADRYAEALARTLQAQEQRLHVAHAAVDATREALQQRYRDREAMERLRARQFEEYRQETLRAEQAALDEAFVLRWQKG